MAGPAGAASCADQWPFICLFGPEASAMQPALVVAQAPEQVAPVQQPQRRRHVAVRKVPEPVARPVVAEAKAENTGEAISAPVVEAKAEPVLLAIPELRLGPGPAFAMSLRLAPAMQEPVTPPTSACVIEQTFNQLFPISAAASKVAENEPDPSQKPLMMVAIKTGSTGMVDAMDDGAKPVALAQDTLIK
jgi:hypothetical protein